MRTYVAKPAEALASRKWWVIDAKDQPLGRIATRIASVLRGKHKATFTPHVDTGDFVIVVNASRVKLTGNKANTKRYYRHSGYAGGMHSKPFSDVVVNNPQIPVEKAVKGMLPKNVLGRQLLLKLKVYGGPEHPHQAQKPEPLAL
ncbi:MAG TPA: 50S ribosomal protein L13 [Polyangiaceae bacterium]|nr:50S ribosomal protein L13 [Polyangiaceae bacterium]